MVRDDRKVNMLELDRHLSHVLEQARGAPVSVQRYGQPWVWILSADAWSDAMRWSALDTSNHPLMLLRGIAEPLLEHLPVALFERPRHVGSMRQLQRAALLVHLRGVASPQRLHDGLQHNALFRAFVGIEPGAVWNEATCEALLDAWREPALRSSITTLLAALPPHLVSAAGGRRDVRQGIAARSDDAAQIEGRCLSN